MQKQQQVQQVSVAKKPEVAPQAAKAPAVLDERLLRQIGGAGPHGRW